MVQKRKNYLPQEYIHIGMAFFLLGIVLSMVAEDRMIGTVFAKMISDQILLAGIQGASAGFSIPIFCVSIYFNLRGLLMLRRH
ncbi:MAG: hypothetical protein C3F13_15985 [Anaerolineales bacterium]|nr:MAG: hypothetical protein C3F13_15985 [Anaerolineales bacterium]